ncbi:hypothetical protein Tco_0298840 [Tanacetum coccineum]
MLVLGENEEGDSTARETTSIQMEKEFQSNDSFEAAPQCELSSKMSPSSEEERIENGLITGGIVILYIAQNLSVMHWEAVKRILRYIKETSDVVLCFRESDFTVKGYVDSDYAGDVDGSKSTAGYVFTLSGGSTSWVSKLHVNTNNV